MDPVEREDVRMIHLDSFGAAKSRNVILTEAVGEIVFFGDDDMRWDESGLKRTIEYFQLNESVDLVLCQSENEFGHLQPARRSFYQQGERCGDAGANDGQIAPVPGQMSFVKPKVAQ